MGRLLRVLRALLVVSLVLSTLGPTRSAMARPPAPTPTAAEEATLATRAPVLRWESGGWLTSFIDSTAAPEALMAATLDLQARVGEVGGVDAIEIYERGSKSFGARWKMSMAVYSSTFHIRYEHEGLYCSFALDGSRDNDLVSSEGSFEVVPISGGSRLVLRSRADAGSWAPDWLERKMTESSARETLAAVRARAEKP